MTATMTDERIPAGGEVAGVTCAKCGSEAHALIAWYKDSTGFYTAFAVRCHNCGWEQREEA